MLYTPIISVWTLECEEEDDMMLKPMKDPTVTTQISRTKSIHLVSLILLKVNVCVHVYSVCVCVCIQLFIFCCALQYNVAHFGCPFEFDLVYHNPEPTQGTYVHTCACTWCICNVCNQNNNVLLQ